jgi:tRNA threonylcarbamoyladenosine modification (KEOPS) complex Cgi121 subunit
MKIMPIECSLSGKALEDALLGHDAVVVDLDKVKSFEEIELAGHLTRKSFEQKSNIARKRKYEFLLWLSGKTDMKGAFRSLNPKGKKMLLVVFSGDEKKILDELKARTLDTGLKTRADPLDLERISLSRIRN